MSDYLRFAIRALPNDCKWQEITAGDLNPTSQLLPICPKCDKHMAKVMVDLYLFQRMSFVTLTMFNCKCFGDALMMPSQMAGNPFVQIT